MKKIIITSSFALFGVMALSSCAKDYTCTCTTTYNGSSYSTTETINGKKEDVEDKCKEDSNVYTVCSIN